MRRDNQLIPVPTEANDLYQLVEIQGKQVAVVTVPKGVDKPYQTGDKYLVRVGSTNRIAPQAELMRLSQISKTICSVPRL